RPRGTSSQTEQKQNGWQKNKAKTRCCFPHAVVSKNTLRFFACTAGPSVLVCTPSLLSSVRLDGLLNLLLDGLQVEARALLHRREFDGRLSELPDLLLRELEAPELVGKPVVVGQRPLIAVGQARPLEGIEPDIGEDGPIDLDRAAQPAARLVGE